MNHITVKTIANTTSETATTKRNERDCNPKTFLRLIKTAAALKCIDLEATSAQTAPLRDDVFKYF